jgi:hypothetical protein
MQVTPRELIKQFAHVLQAELFPTLASVVGPINPRLQLLIAITSFMPIDRLLSPRRRTGRPAKDRTALAMAFLAKAVLNLATTRELLEQLRTDEVLRRLCGWRCPDAIPHESKFSRAFAEFAAVELPQQLHEAIIATTQQNRLVGHIARDSTAIPARERFEPKALAKTKERKRRKTKRQKGSHLRAPAQERGTRIQRQRHQDIGTMLADLPQGCDAGSKKVGHGQVTQWCGYKLHLDVADGQIPITALLTSASVHDSQVAIPLMSITSKRVTYLYELMDSAYDADDIHAHSRHLNHVPIIAPHPRRGTKKPSLLTKVHPPKPCPELTWAQKDRYKERTMSERVNARLKDEFGARNIRVRGPAKIMAHLMFGVLALTVDQLLRLGR